MKKDQKQSKLNFTQAEHVSDPLTSLLNKKPSSAPSGTAKQCKKDSIFSELYVISEAASENLTNDKILSEQKLVTAPNFSDEGYLNSRKRSDVYDEPNHHSLNQLHLKNDPTMEFRKPQEVCYDEESNIGQRKLNKVKTSITEQHGLNKIWDPSNQENKLFCETLAAKAKINNEEPTFIEKKPLVLSEHVKLKNESPKLLQQTRRGPNSSFAVFTQSVLGHARGLQALARTAASTWLNQTPLNASNLLWEEAENITANLNSSNQQGWSPPPFKYCENVMFSSSDLESEGEEEKQDKLGEQVFDPRLPFFGWFQNAWKKTLELTYYEKATNFLCRVIKCSSCFLVFCLFHWQNQNEFFWRPLLPENLILDLPSQTEIFLVEDSKSLFSDNQHDLKFKKKKILIVAEHKEETCQNSCKKNLISAEYSDVSIINEFHEIVFYPLEIIRRTFSTTWVLWNNYPPIFGSLVCTNFRLIFLIATKKLPSELVLGTQWMLFNNFWNIPISCIDKLTQVQVSSQEREIFSSMILEPTAESSALLIESVQKNQFVPGAQRLATSTLKTELKNCVQVETKDNRKFRIISFDRKHRDLSITFFFQSLLSTSSSLAHEKKNLPFDFKINQTPNTAVYNPIEEWQRLLVHAQDWLRVSTVNSTYSICSTYPKLVITPKQISDEQIIKVASFRTKQRFPMLSWAGPPLFGTLWRSSQPKSMFNRCWEDEFYLSLIAESSLANFNSKKNGKIQNYIPMLILDARPLINAIANKAAGAGFENTSVHYKFCRIEFANIDNIHHVREAWKKMALAVSSVSSNFITLTDSYYQSLNIKDFTQFYKTNSCEACPKCGEKFAWCSMTKKDEKRASTLCMNPSLPIWSYSEPLPPLAITSFTNFSNSYQLISQSQWYTYVQLILKATGLVVSRLTQGEPVLVHCSDGWDRTAQLSSLSMLCVDPYYRSTRGFCILIEQEFLNAGHPFHSRCRHNDNLACSSPKMTKIAQDDGKLTEKTRFCKEDKNHESLLFLGAYDLAVRSSGISKTNFDENISHRNVHGSNDFSPIFIQWLDCVGQLLYQFPDAFEFDIKLIDFLASQLYSCFYDTFLMNCPKEREVSKLSNDNTLCIWQHILKNVKYFQSRQEFVSQPSILPPPLLPNPMNVQVWNTYWFRFQPQGLQYLMQAIIH